MERLTFDGNFCDIVGCLLAPGSKYCQNGNCSHRRIWERLKMYENTGLSPEEIASNANELLTYRHLGTIFHLANLVQAEQEGRLVVLPCDANIELQRGGYIYKGDHWNMPSLTAFREADTPSGLQVAIFSIEEAEAALEAQKGGDENG